MDNQVKGRAYTDAEKQVVMNRLLAVWQKYPDMRLGQLIRNAFANDIFLFYAEDDALCVRMEDFLVLHPPT